MTATPAHPPHPTMTATCEPFEDHRWRNTKTPYAVILATPNRTVVQHYHFPTMEEATMFHGEWKP